MAESTNMTSELHHGEHVAGTPDTPTILDTEQQGKYSPVRSSRSSRETGHMSCAATIIAETVESGSTDATEKGLDTFAKLQTSNKVYLAMPNLSDHCIVGMLYLGSQAGKLLQDSLEVGENSDKHGELIRQMIETLIQFGHLRTMVNDGKKLPKPMWTDIKKLRSKATHMLANDNQTKNSNWLVDHDINDWSRISVMTPTEHLVSRLPNSKLGGWIPARLRPSHKVAGIEEYAPWLRQFFSVAAEILFIILIWVFGSVPVIIKSLENPRKELEVAFYSVFFVFWSIMTSMLTSSFETRLFLNVGMAALYVQNIRAD